MKEVVAIFGLFLAIAAVTGGLRELRRISHAMEVQAAAAAAPPCEAGK